MRALPRHIASAASFGICIIVTPTMFSSISVILILGTILLACGSLGLLLVRLSNKSLSGIGWLSGALQSGALANLLIVTHSHSRPRPAIAAADVLILLSFVLLHVAIRRLMNADSLFPRGGAILLTTQVALSLYFVFGKAPLCPTCLRSGIVGLLIAAQVAQTSFRLFQYSRSKIKNAARFTAVLMAIYAVLNVARAITGVFSLIQTAQLFHLVEILAFAVYIAVFLGIAFGYFWMTTSLLSEGLETMASTDPLTRLYNRRVFLLWCDRERERSDRLSQPFSILMIDLDHFKRINDNYGHQGGDLALCAAVEKMQDAVRGIDVLGRWGGEEFAALLPNANHDAAALVAERVRANIEKLLLRVSTVLDGEGAATIRVTASIGIATYNGIGDQVENVIHRADLGLYAAKAAGRNRVASADDVEDIAASSEASWHDLPTHARIHLSRPM